MANQRLGDYVFVFNPDNMSVVETKKLVGKVNTDQGAAIFEWPAILQGTEFVLSWNWMYETQYSILRKKYIQTGVTFEWNPQTGGNTYEVVILDMNGKYFETLLHGGPYRENVEMLLSVNSQMSTTTTTTTTTSTTTTTT